MYILDTNAIYHIGNTAITSHATVSRLASSVSAGRIRIGYTPLQVIEVFSGIERSPGNFAQLRRGARRLRSISAEILCDPIQRVKQLLGLSRTRWQDVRPWHGAIREIARAQNADELTYLRECLDGYRVEEEEDYVSAFMDIFLAGLKEKVIADPGADTRLKGQYIVPLVGKELAVFESALGTEAMETSIVTSELHNCNLDPPSDPEEFGTVRQRLHYFIRGWELMLACICRDGRIPKSGKNRNDFSDIRLLLYISPDDESAIVSDDRKGPFGKFARAFPKRVIDFEAFLRCSDH